MSQDRLECCCGNNDTGGCQRKSFGTGPVPRLLIFTGQKNPAHPS